MKIQRSRQNGKTKKQTPNERIRKFPEEEIEETDRSNLADREFTVMVIRILKSIKKIY